MSFELKNRVALVTGANRGIGKAIVESFIAHGASKVYLAVRNIDSTKELVDRYGDKVVPLYVDVAQEESIKALAKQANDVSIVVNNAGILEVEDPLGENAENALLRELNVNVIGLLRMAQAFYPVLEKNTVDDEGSAFVQLNSVVSIKNFHGVTTYSASKAAAYSITQGLRESFEPQGIQVLSVHPGPIATDMAAQIGVEDGEPATVVSEGIISALQSGDFHLFPDTVAKEFEGAYQSYAKSMIEVELSEA